MAVYKRAISGLLVFAIILSAAAVVCAEDGPTKSNNIGKNNYADFSSTVKSYLVAQKDGSFMRVEAINGQVVIETYSSELQFKSALLLKYELPLFGGFYEGTDSFFLVFGQENPAEDDATEVIRVVRYDKSWNRLSAASLYGANTAIPFEEGSLRMVQSGDFLYIHTCHEMYHLLNGINQQANLMLAVRISTMEVEECFDSVGDSSDGYVGRSFNQFIAADEDAILSVNHGNAYPRAVVLSRYALKTEESIFANNCVSVETLPIAGESGDYNTGTSVGGFEVSATSYLIAGNSADRAVNENMNAVRNIFVTSTLKTRFSADGTRCIWITNYPTDDSSYFGQVSTPHIVTVENGFLLLWTVKGRLNYVFLDDNGDMIGEIMSADAALSDCKPIVADGAVYWYCTQNSAPVFYCIDPEKPETVTEIPTEQQEQEEPTQPTEETGIMPYSEQEHEEICPSRFFSDVPGVDYWGHEGIDFVVENGLFNGMSATTFEPDTTMTRAMLVTVLWRAAGMPRQGTNPFYDVPENVWFTDAVKWASDCNLVNGMQEGKFCPQENITREQMAAILYRYAQYNAQDVSGMADLSAFPDELTVSGWAENAMCWAVAEGIIGGLQTGETTILLPQGNATRAQVATILMRFLQE